MNFETDHDALTFLEGRGYLIHHGTGIILRHRKGDSDEEAAIKFLCDEYDYAWNAATHPAEEPSNEPEDRPYNEDSMPHLGDSEDLSTQL